MTTTTPKARLGAALRAIRSQMRLTLADVSARTGVSVSTLSKVENGQLSPTYDKLVQLSEGLEVDIGAFFDAEPRVAAAAAPAGPVVTARRSLARRGQGLLVETPCYDYRYLCTDLAKKAMVPILITIRARSLVQVGAFSKHSGEEFIYVLRGTVEVHTEFYEPATLRTGEGVYIDSTMFHASLTAGPRSALVLNVCYSPNAGHFRTLVELARTSARASERAGGAPLDAREPG
jgi:transcriptional regulator with XRE-family HTH domain